MLWSVPSSDAAVAIAVFFACAVESVEALTVVVAVGATRGWRPALWGAAGALAVLAAVVLALGPALTRLPISGLRVAVGAALLLFGLQWLRKAVLRAGGLLAHHDEDEIYQRQVAELGSAGDHRSGPDRVGMAVAFKGVFLEGIEVVIIVLTVGASSQRLGLAVLAAVGAVLLVTITGLVVARYLPGLPENAVKMTVGLMLVSFGTFWLGEGLDVGWPGSDAAVLYLVATYGIVAFVVSRALRHAVRTAGGERPGAGIHA
jgi:Ca2+/H+ antiporter, TMEM165/GDT1 family